MSGATDRFNEFARGNGAPESVFEKEYQLSYDDVIPRRWYLSIDKSEARLIKSSQLNGQKAFRDWCSDNGHTPPMTTSVPMFEMMMGRLYDEAVKREGTLPFFLTDAGCIENLENYFDTHIPNMVRMKGQEFLTGKIGDYVRIKEDVQRIYFKWQSLKRWCMRSLNAQEKELDALKMLISAKGGYQGEEGARDWVRWTYWVPFNVFTESKVWKWLHPDEPEEGGEK
jgi:hypothetical protein